MIFTIRMVVYTLMAAIIIGALLLEKSKKDLG